MFSKIIINRKVKKIIDDGDIIKFMNLPSQECKHQADTSYSKDRQYENYLNFF